MQTTLYDLFPKIPNKQIIPGSKKPWYSITKSWRLRCPGNPNLWKLYNNEKDFPFTKTEKWFFSKNKYKWASINYTIWIKTYEMLSTYKSKAKKTNME